MKWLRSKLGLIIISAVRARRGVVEFYADSERREMLDVVARVRKERKLLLSDLEALVIMSCVRSAAKVPGDIAEVGTYQGASSKLIAEARAADAGSVHLFDTFEGLPKIQEIDRSTFKTGQYGADFEDVSNYLSAYPNIFLYKGLFPETAGPVRDKKFSFVHLDVDLYESTKLALEFFYPRMSPGGIIVSHDYPTAPGVKEAVDEFMQGKAEPVLELSARQCCIVKLC